MPTIRGVVFDKDGTLLDFHATWDTVFGAMLADFAAGNADKLGAVIRRPPGDLALVKEIEVAIESYAPAIPTPEPGAVELLAALAARGVPMAVATNDKAARAEAQLAALGWASYFEAVIGYDSGFGQKPGPGMVRAAATALAVPFQDVAMVGDSSTDTGSSNAAGTITVLYGPRADLVADADIVLAHLGSLLDHIAVQ
jgi:phosphoglycolate phosphatase